MTTIHPVQVYLDANGNVTEWVVSDDDGYSPSERPGMVRVPVSRAAYDTLPSPINVGGVAVCHDLRKLCIPVLTTLNPSLATVCQTASDTFDGQLASQAQAALTAQAAGLAAWNALPQAVRDAAIAADAIPHVVGP